EDMMHTVTTFCIVLVIFANYNTLADKQICTTSPYSKHLVEKGCRRYVKNYDITGVATTVNLKFTSKQNECDCMLKCLESYKTCASWVWKTVFVAPKMHSYSCTLYSTFNLPPNVNIGYNTTSSKNIKLLEDNPQTGGLVPHCDEFGANENIKNTDFSHYIAKLSMRVELASKPELNDIS
ncbi:unnamed protein product, partial [Didymodactylos carnosus]